MYMKIKHLLFFIPVTFLVACEGTDLIEPDNVSKEQISTQIIYNGSVIILGDLTICHKSVSLRYAT